MPTPAPNAASPTRERILDAAATVLRERGVAHVTTKEIARAAGCSEALLYKHFSDKQALFMAVLRERAGGALDLGEDPGTGEVRDNLIDTVEGLLAFYVVSFPMSASIFSSHALLTAWREQMTTRGAGPRSPLRALEAYLDAEIELGRLERSTDSFAVASLLCGAAFQHAFLACFDGLTAVPGARGLAERLVDSTLEL
ncbi:TetR/AcrR family transcriptional regulator [Galbitalea sp. SE-J8]|uniref:TetR/AcrR family transcriptional regulator n=1 Tax=Galbitalea sp. SE-J8 TaxID=3054952 RepID=UPI00259CC2B0|nr:TetR/AcrR family transcriptional regulator [Galbitalea sp. SE-J8]MDM4762374.1 TetR/AcrR family transcriptional regulator [Galbitalea sp. SE-J8]